MQTFLLAFIPLFVAIDLLGGLPLFISLTQGMEDRRRRSLTLQATLTALGLSLVFVVGGKLVFSFLGITESDFRVGGGVVLLVFAVHNLLFSREHQEGPPVEPQSTIGIVPLGVPLIMGPAALTTVVILADLYGYVWTVLALVANLAVVGLAFLLAGPITRLTGTAALRAIAKVITLLLAGIAVMMIRSGIAGMARS